MATRSPRDRGEPAKCKTNVTAAASSFVGRVADRLAIAERFEEGARLVTITGLGGMGKTRVAQRFAEEQAEAYSAHGDGGAWFCDLSGARSALGACAVVASVLGVALSGGEDEREVAADLGRALSRRQRILLVLDNVEPIAASADVTIGRWMSAAPRARFLVTSRVALGLPGEHLWPLGPLELPDDAARDPKRLASIEAVDLFVRRARQVRPDVPSRPEDWVAVADVVRRLDGIPLAIELAAARVGVLSLAQLRDRLAQPLTLLVRRGDVGRHASMRRAIVDSVEQLDEAERACLAGSAVFSGGFTLEAAEAVLGGGDRPVLPVLEGLCAHSLLRATPVHDLGGELRFSLFEAIRELSEERLAAAPARRLELTLRHAAFYARMARALAALSATDGGAELVARVDHDLDNLIAAHASAIEDPGPQGAPNALVIALGLDPLLTRRGLFRLRLRLLDEAIARARSAAPRSDLAAALLSRGRARRELGGMAQARVDFEDGLALARAEASPALEALAYMRLGELVETDGATEEARGRFTIALTRARAAPRDRGAQVLEAEIRAHLAHAHRREGALALAAREIYRAIELFRCAGHAEGLGMVLYEAAVVALFRQRFEEALGQFDEAIVIVRRIGARQAEGALLSGRGVLLQERGELDAALDHHARAVEIFREVGNLHREASALYYLAGAYLERGQRADAMRLLERALDLIRVMGVPRYEALVEACRATLFAAAGDLTSARASIAAAERAAAACRSELALTATVAIHRLFVVFMEGGGQGRALCFDEARRLADAHASDDPRFALRAVLACVEPGGGSRLTTAPLVIRAGGRAFRLPGALRDVDLERRAPLRRIVLALARRRLDAPGEGLVLEEILAAGWPGERVRESAGANRVHVALATLRKLGLRAVLVSDASGYSLTTAAPCVLEEEGRQEALSR